jgi:hypothetical protein
MLPVLDLTNPAFAVTVPGSELDALTARFVEEARARPPMSDELRDRLRQSRLGRAVSGGTGSFVGGLATYLMKLGPDHLWPEASPVDRAIAGSFPALMTRLRTQDVADLMAEWLSGQAAGTERPIVLVNIGGGPASDSWNALLRLQADRPGALARRAVRILVLDGDASGPAFGSNAVDVLRGPDGPLAGVDVALSHALYDWTSAAALPDLLASWAAPGVLCGVSSEGALFEYGTDGDIVANLRAIREATPADAIVAGSVTRDGEPEQTLLAGSAIAVRPRTLEAFSALAREGGWQVDRLIERPFSWHVRLIKA